MSDAAPQTYDLVILGAGTGGYSAAFRAGQLGLTVALVDAYKIGGTCLHIGCIPTKAMLESADLLDRIKHASDFGITVSPERAASACSPNPRTHSGSGPSKGSPVKNFAAMHPP